MSDGTFGTTADEGPLDPAIVAAVEEHRFEPLTRLSWRNTRLRFQSVGALLRSLDERPPTPGLVQARDADDHRALQLLSRNAEVNGAGDQSRRGAAPLGSLPDPRFPQGHERQPRAVSGALLRASRRAGRAAAEPVGRRADGAARSARRRYRHADDADRPYPHLDLHHPSRRLARQRRRLAGAGPRHRGPAVGRAARQHHPALCRPPFGLSGAPSGQRRRAAGLGRQGRRGARSRAPMSAGSTGSALSPDATDGRGDAHPVDRGQPGVAGRGRGARAAARRRCATTRSRSTPAGRLLWHGDAVGRLAAGEAVADAAGRGAAPAIFSRARRANGSASGCSCSSKARSSAVSRRCSRRRRCRSTGPARGIVVPAGRCARLRHGRSGLGTARRSRPGQPAARSAGSGCGSAPRASMSSRCCAPNAARFRALLWAVRHGSAGAAAARRRPSTRQGVSGRSRSAAVVLRRDRPARRRRAGACVPTGWSGSPRRAPTRAQRPVRRRSPSWRRIAGVAPGDLRRRLAGARLSRGDRGRQTSSLSAGRAAAARSRRCRRAAPRDGHPFAKLKELKFA